MIAKLKGKITDLKPTELVLYVNDGVGYQVFIPFSTFEKISGEKETELLIYTLHKEDQFKLFGFFSREEKELFTMLININGIGPSLALSILSGIQLELLIGAVNEGNPSILTRIPGIGKSKAEKLVFELKRKIGRLEMLSPVKHNSSSVRNDAVDALMSLGFDELKVRNVIDDILKTDSGIGVENLVKAALKTISSI